MYGPWFKNWLFQIGCPLTKYKEFALSLTAEIDDHVRHIAFNNKMNVIYLESAATKRRGLSKDDMARKIALDSKVSTGLVCIFKTLEVCRTISPDFNKRDNKIILKSKSAKCSHYYFYFIDKDFGWVHVRLQSWIPFSIQVYLNGHEVMARQFDNNRIKYEMYENSFTKISNLQAANKLRDRLINRKWPRALNRLARIVNPHYAFLRSANRIGYWWVTDQMEISTDVLFRKRSKLEAIMPEITRHSMNELGCRDVLRFFGRKPHGNYKGDTSVDLKQRPEGVRVKFYMKGNSVKCYDKWSVLRFETTINRPREFKALKKVQIDKKARLAWVPMGKSVKYFSRYFAIGCATNKRYYGALSKLRAMDKPIKELDRVCHSRMVNGKRTAKFNPLTNEDHRLFKAVLDGRNLLGGFRNANILSSMYPETSEEVGVNARLRNQISRKLIKLVRHGLIAKFPRSHRYRITPTGLKILSAFIRYRSIDFPENYMKVA